MQADKFHKTGRQLRSKMWWQNMKMKVLVVSAGLVAFKKGCYLSQPSKLMALVASAHET